MSEVLLALNFKRATVTRLDCQDVVSALTTSMTSRELPIFCMSAKVGGGIADYLEVYKSSVFSRSESCWLLPSEHVMAPLQAEIEYLFFYHQ